jgi:hypothetical protein
MSKVIKVLTKPIDCVIVKFPSEKLFLKKYLLANKENRQQ